MCRSHNTGKGNPASCRTPKKGMFNTIHNPQDIRSQERQFHHHPDNQSRQVIPCQTSYLFHVPTVVSTESPPAQYLQTRDPTGHTSALNAIDTSTTYCAHAKRRYVTSTTANQRISYNDPYGGSSFFRTSQAPFAHFYLNIWPKLKKFHFLPSDMPICTTKHIVADGL